MPCLKCTGLGLLIPLSMTAGCLAEAVVDHDCPQSVRYEGFSLGADDPDKKLEALRGVTEIIGDLNLSGSGSYAPLSCLRRVQGQVSLGGLSDESARSLVGLERVESLRIVHSDSLTTLDGLSGLETIDGDLTLSVLTGLSDLSGLSGASLGGGLDVFEVPSEGVLPPIAGEVVHGSIVVYGPAPDLTAFTEAIVEVHDRIEVTAAADRVDFSSLVRVEGWLTLNGDGSQQLAPLDNLEHVTGALSLSMLGNTELPGLSALQRAGALILSDLPSLTSLDGLSPALQLVNPGGLANADAGLFVGGCDKLVDVSGLGGAALVSSARWLRIASCAALSDLTGTAGYLEHGVRIDLVGLPPLVDLQGWSSATSVSAVSIASSGLVSLDGLAPSTGIWFRDQSDGAFFELFNNASLVDVSAAIPAAGQTVPAEGFVHMTDNPSLPQCAADELAAALQDRGFEGRVALSDLGTGPC